MDFAQLKTSLKTKIDPVYWLYGADYFLINKAVDLLHQALPDAEFNKYDETTTADVVVNALATMGFFSTARLVVYTLPEKGDLSAVREYLRNPVAGSVLVLLDYHEKPTANLTAATSVNCNPLPAEILRPLIAKQITPHTITPDAAQYLVDATGGYYGLIDNELQKFLAFYPEVPTFTVEHLAPYLAKTIDYQIYELGTAILQRQVAKAAQIWAFLQNGNTNEYAVFGGIVSQLRRAYYATATTGDINLVGKILGCSPYAVKYSRRDFGNNPAGVRACYRQALDLEYQIKTGQVLVPQAVAALIYR